MTEKDQYTIKISLMFQIHFQLAVMKKYRAIMEEKYEFQAFKPSIVPNNYEFFDDLISPELR